MIVLDTNVISEMMRPAPDPGVEAWLASQNADAVFLTAVTAAELRYGLAIMAAGQRRTRFETALDAILREDFAGRVLAFEEEAAWAYARIGASRRASGAPISQFDCQIAAICQVASASLATRNVADFAGCGVDLIDPWQV